MSGGAFEHDDRRIVYIADCIEQYIAQDFRYTDGRQAHDRIQCDTPEQRALIVAEAKALVDDLRKIAKRCRNLDYLLSSDHGPKAFLNNLQDP